MFGLSALFTVIRELRDEIAKSRDFFRAANAQLAKHINVEEGETPKVETNGHRRLASK